MEDSEVDCVENKQNTIETQPTKGITHARTNRPTNRENQRKYKVHRRKLVFREPRFRVNGRQTHGRDANEKVHIATRTGRKTVKEHKSQETSKIANEI